ncbi:MAG: hypothetical protein ACRDQ2_14660, partial [Gaiellales bacterium]
KELRVMSREEILPTYKIPALVRAPEGQVEVRGRYSNPAALLDQLRRLSGEHLDGDRAPLRPCGPA